MKGEGEEEEEEKVGLELGDEGRRFGQLVLRLPLELARQEQRK